jgi:hypothetical protein
MRALGSRHAPGALTWAIDENTRSASSSEALAATGQSRSAFCQSNQEKPPGRWETFAGFIVCCPASLGNKQAWTAPAVSGLDDRIRWVHHPIILLN